MNKQENPWGCGVYAIANACNLPTYITDARIEASKNGNNLGQLSKWLQEDGQPMFIEALYYNHSGKKLPVSATGYKPMGDVYFLPVLINVRFSDGGLNHLIGGKIDKSGVLYLYDSLKETMIETSLSKINSLYHNVYGLYVISAIEDGSYVFI